MLKRRKGLNGWKKCWSKKDRGRKSEADKFESTPDFRLRTKFNYMPLSFHGIGPMAISLMVLTLVIRQAWLYFRHRHH